VRNRDELLELAEQHGVPVKRRHFFDRRDDNGKRSVHFMDLPRPIKDIRDELVAKGVLT
jgi:hypothetical protein